MSGDYNANLAKTALNEVYVAANEVYTQGSGAKTTITVTLPSNIVSSEISEKQMVYKLNMMGYQNDYFRSFDFQVIGELPTESGLHMLSIESKNGYVIINEKFLDIEPIFLNVNSMPGNITTAQVSFASRYNATLNISVLFLSEPELSNNITYPSSFILMYNGNYTFPITFSLPAYASKKRYYGIFKFNITNTLENKSDIMNVDMVVDLSQGLVEVQNNAAFIYPTRWDSELVPNQTESQNFFICSGYPTLESYNIWFSPDLVGGWMSFTPFGAGNKTSLMNINISSNECELFTVYQKGDTITEGNYVGAILSISPENVSLSTLVYTTIFADNAPPNITGFNISTDFGFVDDKICLYVNATDNVELSTVWVKINKPSGISFDTYLSKNSSCPNSSGMYSGYFLLSEAGIYYLNQTYAEDLSYNKANFTVNRVVFSKKVIFRETPIFAIEEAGRAGRQSWNGTPFEEENDGNFAVTNDGANPPVPPDYIDFTWGNFSINNSENISQLKLTYIHRDRFSDSGTVDYNNPSEDYRHKVECLYNGTWMFLETYGLSRDPDAWVKYELLDLSRCINRPSDLNGFQMRITFDPADNAGGSYSDIDLVELMAVTTVSESPVLPERISDYPQPVDFTSGINATANTFGWSGASDGWDYIDNIYSLNSTAPATYVTHGDPSGFSNYVATVKRIEVKMGLGSDQELEASGAWGVDVNITDRMYDLISKGAHLYYSFNYYVEDLDTDLEEPCWVKTRFNGTYLGWDLDGHPDFYLHYSDDTPEVWAIVDTNHPDGWNEIVLRSFGWDVTNLVTGPGKYYIDMGGKVDFRTGSTTSKATTEGCGVYFDNIRLMIVDE